MPARNVASKLNVLESVIVRGEDSAEDARWGQAKEVVHLIDQGHKQREIAANWINGRTDRPYVQQHVSFCKQVWERWGTSELVDRPDWTTAYYTVQQRADDVVEPERRRKEWSEAHEARAPKSTRAAEKFVENLQDAPPQVIETIARGAREVQEKRYVAPKERARRKEEAEAFAEQTIRPALDEIAKTTIDLLFEQLLEELRDLDVLEPDERDRYLARMDEVRTEIEVKYGMRSLR